MLQVPDQALAAAFRKFAETEEYQKAINSFRPFLVGVVIVDNEIKHFVEYRDKSDEQARDHATKALVGQC